MNFKYVKIFNNLKFNKSLKLTIVSKKSAVKLAFVSLSLTSICLLTRKPKILNELEPINKVQEAEPKKHESKVIRSLGWYIKEPIMIMIRFTFLLLNFSPVIVSISFCFFGERIIEKDNERSGTLLFYKILKSRCESAGPTFIKLAQWAASRSDIFPKMFCIILSDLQSKAQAHSFRHTRKLIENTFGLELEDIFEEFDSNPIGVGAIAQKIEDKEFFNSHENKLPEMDFDNEAMAIKILHPNVREIIERDLIIMKFFANLLNFIPRFKWLSLPGEVDTFGEMMKSQLDLRLEACNLLKLRANFENSKGVEFPKPYTQLTTQNILIEEYQLALPISLILHCNLPTVFDQSLAYLGLTSFLHMLIYDNFVHSDLHPGNIMVKFYLPQPFRIQPNKEQHNELIRSLKEIQGEEEFQSSLNYLFDMGFRAKLVFLDAGLVSFLDDVNRRNLLDLFKAIAEFDGLKAGKLMVERCKTKEMVLNSDIFAIKMDNLIREVKNSTFRLKNIQLSKILGDVMDMVQEHHVKLESDFVNVVISILILEGIGRKLDSNLDLFSMALPILRDFTSFDVPKQVIQNAKENRETGAWWLKLWVQLEARQWLTTLKSAHSDKDIQGIIRIYAYDFFDM